MCLSFCVCLCVCVCVCQSLDVCNKQLMCVCLCVCLCVRVLCEWQYECTQCGTTMFVAKGHEFKFFGDNFKCGTLRGWQGVLQGQQDRQACGGQVKCERLNVRSKNGEVERGEGTGCQRLNF